MNCNETEWYEALEDEWDIQKNEKHISEYSKSNQKSNWWKCKNYGHSYQNTISNRFNRGDNCPYCSGRRLLQGFNDLETKYPDLAEEFDVQKNKIQSSNIYPSKSKSVWWKCKLNHSWKTTFGTRIEGSGCPYCSNRKVLSGFNDLATTHPKIAQQWNLEKNELLPTEVTYGSPKTVWWRCEFNHEWKTAISKRQTRNCPYCSNQKIIQGYNDLATIHPDIAKEWDYNKNNLVRPTMVSPGSPKSYWWKCSKGHEWKTAVNTRVGYKTSCPYCSQTRILSGFNDLLTLNPKLVENSWDYEKNNSIKIYPNQIGKSSTVKVWWKCRLGHHWESTVVVRLLMKFDGCVYCNNRRVLIGFNDFETKFPDLLNEWDYEKNLKLPSEYTFKSNLETWWKCSKGHSWKAKIYTRTILQTECLRCFNGKHVSKPENELIKHIEAEYGKIVAHSRKIIPPYELDIYIPELNLAIEFNGLYWHSEAKGKDQNYHYKKWKMCQDKEINLITVWEDDWKEDSDLIKQKLTSILKKNSDSEQSILISEEIKLIQERSQYFDNKKDNEYIFRLQNINDLNTLGAISGRLSTNKKIFKILKYTSFTNKNILKFMIEEISKILNCDSFEYTISNDDNYFKKEVEKVFTENKKIKPYYKILVNSQRYDKTDISICRYTEANPNIEMNKVWDSGSQLYKLTLPKEIQL